MTVEGCLSRKKENITIKELVANLEGMKEYSLEFYGDKSKLTREYDGDYESAYKDPWLQDYMTCDKAIEIINNLISYIEETEGDNATKILNDLGVLKGESL